jgi:CelD/BcsL family acetyltransferase involved in cellulose biosynthesis
MNIRATTFDRLTPGEIAAWASIQRENPLLDSPYFCSEFTQSVAQVRNDVEVAVLEEGHEVVGFFPFQRTSWNNGKPVGGRLSDFQAVIARPGIEYDPRQLVRSCGLSTWHFDHLLNGGTAFAPFVWREADSPCIDLPDGFEAYVAQRENGRKMVSRHGQQKRKLSREIGPVRFEPHVTDRAVFNQVIDWKSRQFQETGVPNIFDRSWVTNLLEAMLQFQGEQFSPMLSVLYAGDRLAAASFSMRAADVYHLWFPTYDVELSQHSPGTMLLVELLQAAEVLGIRRIDLGKGPEAYKQRTMTGARRVTEGTVDLRSSAAMMRWAWRHARDRIRSSPLYTPAKVPARMLYQVRSWLELR